MVPCAYQPWTNTVTLVVLAPVVNCTLSLVNDGDDGVNVLGSLVPVPVTPMNAYVPCTQPARVYVWLACTRIDCVHCALSELFAAADSACVPPWTGLETTVSSGEQLHEPSPLSKPGLASRLPPVGVGVPVGVAVGVGVGVLVGVGVGVGVRVGVGVGVGAGPEPLNALKTFE